MIPGTSGPTSPPPLAFYDPDSGSLKTSQLTLAWASATSSPILPASGSMRSGLVYVRPTWAPPTRETASSSSPGRPTQATRHGTATGQTTPGRLPSAGGTLTVPAAPIRPGGRQPRCPTAAALLLPTPSASEAAGAGHQGRAGGMNLRTAVDLLPTPRASPNEDRQTRRTPSQEAGTHGRSLAAEVCTVAGPATPPHTRNPTTTSSGTRIGRRHAAQMRQTPPPCSRRKKSGDRMPGPWPDGPLSSAVPLPAQPTLWDD